MESSTLFIFGSIIGVFGLVGAVLAALRRRHYLVHVALALYVTVAILAAVPHTWTRDAMQALMVLGGVFVLVLFLGSSLFWAVDEWPDHRVPWRFMVFGAAVLGMAMSIALPYLHAAGVVLPAFIGADVVALFTKGVAPFVWTVAPLLAATVLRRM